MVITASIGALAVAVLAGYAMRKRFTGIVWMEPVSQWWLAEQRHQDFVRNC